MLNALRNANQSLLIIIVGCIVMGSLIFGLSGSNQRFAENAALETARSYSQTFTSIRNFYQENVVERLQGTNAEIVHNFREVDGAIPIPATMMIELTTYLNKTNTDVTFALVSDYPFPWRSSRPLVDFDVKAIEFLRETGLEEFFEFRVENDTTYLHYARPVIMVEGCVDCHNNHPDSPKTDWEVGDVRAVQIFELPFDSSASDMSFDTAIFVSVIMIISITTMYALLASNIRSQRTQSQLRSEAHFDNLTKAMRRPRFQELYDHKNREKTYLLALIDIDDFKSFNTDFGHSVGDTVLREVVQAISDNTKDAEVLCRYGGEEFLLLVDRRLVGGNPQQYFDRLVAGVQNHTFTVKERQLSATISLGYRVLTPDENLNICAERADAALRYAKRSGKNQAVEADRQLLQALGYLDQAYRTSDLEKALADGQLYFDFEPILNLTDGSIVSYEALIRMRLPDQTVVPPSVFLPQYMSALRNPNNVEKLRATLARSLKNSTTSVEEIKKISFNLDPYDLINHVEENCLIVVLQELIKEGYNIAIEIVETPYTETVSSDKFSEKLDVLKSNGFLVYMDDFGKEGSSLQRFMSFNFDAIKVDRSIITGLETCDRTKGLISILVKMTQSSGTELIVEGVETRSQLSELTRLGVTRAQGYLFREQITF